MVYNSAEALREAGILGGTMRPELEEFYGSLSKEETDVIISVKNRLAAVLQEHGEPVATAQAEPGQAAGQPGRALVQGRVGEALAASHDGLALRVTLGGVEEAPREVHRPALRCAVSRIAPTIGV